MVVQIPREVTQNRIRALRRRMSIDRFKRIPRRLGWQYEYFEGMAYVKPYRHMVVNVLDLSPRAPCRRREIRPLATEDADALVVPFLTAFAQTPEYAAYPLARFRKGAFTYLEGFFGSERGERSPASVVAEVDGRIVGGALVKRQPRHNLLDCLFVLPECWRKGLATALVDCVVDTLFRAGNTRLNSYALLANETSLAWHRAYGFREVPDLSIAALRFRHYRAVLQQHREAGDLSEAELARLVELEAYWGEESTRLYRLDRLDDPAAYARLE